MTEQISPDELAYQSKVIADLRNAQAAFSSWGAHMAARYNLGPDDRLDESGVIVRAPEDDESTTER